MCFLRDLPSSNKLGGTFRLVALNIALKFTWALRKKKSVLRYLPQISWIKISGCGSWESAFSKFPSDSSIYECLGIVTYDLNIGFLVYHLWMIYIRGFLGHFWEPGRSRTKAQNLQLWESDQLALVHNWVAHTWISCALSFCNDVICYGRRVWTRHWFTF